MRSVMSVLAVAVAVVAGGCSSSNPVAPGEVTGKWAQPFSIAGSFFEITLVASGTDVTGTGRACGEAGPCSNIAIQGTSGPSGVHLAFVSTQTVPTQGVTSSFRFDGKLVSVNTLRGTWVEVFENLTSSDPVAITFQRE